jgi:putative flippase GtrA
LIKNSETLTPADVIPTRRARIRARARAVREHKEVGRFAKFLVVGAIGAVIDYSVYTGLNAIGWLDGVRVALPFGLVVTGLGINGAIAFTLAVVSNFLWNRYWTYPDSRSKRIFLQLLTFFGINVVGLAIRIPVLELLHRPLGALAHTVVPTLSEETAAWIGESGAWGAAVVIVLFWNFFVNRYLTYNDID